ncbi:endonuclease [Amycolatopsis coloradensis]|uniref:Endonuclease n=1 Tax=Amycolatopsis coloradensis TaxID=76021 RepID=A0A1R0KZ81_9PSEU|nr:endonuclease [Amycolatopsis coloradensis]OLZ54656.1 endonuclease [Amycolatopsis coloradensis]
MNDERIVRRLLEHAGPTYAAEAGVKLADQPSPLYRLLVLSTLLSTRIKSDIAVDAAKELSKAKLTTPRAMADARRQHRVDALGRVHYKRYDEQTATALGESAKALLGRYSGDLRKLREEAGRDRDGITERLRKFSRIGPVGADIFCREAQLVWPELRPYFDKKALDGAKRVGLPTDADALARLTDAKKLAPLAANLVRVALDKDLADEITGD